MFLLIRMLFGRRAARGGEARAWPAGTVRLPCRCKDTRRRALIVRQFVIDWRSAGAGRAIIRHVDPKRSHIDPKRSHAAPKRSYISRQQSHAAQTWSQAEPKRSHAARTWSQAARK
jgi:hypothetical protein